MDSGKNGLGDSRCKFFSHAGLAFATRMNSSRNGRLAFTDGCCFNLDRTPWFFAHVRLGTLSLSLCLESEGLRVALVRSLTDDASRLWTSGPLTGCERGSGNRPGSGGPVGSPSRGVFRRFVQCRVHAAWQRRSPVKSNCLF